MFLLLTFFSLGSFSSLLKRWDDSCKISVEHECHLDIVKRAVVKITQIVLPIPYQIHITQASFFLHSWKSLNLERNQCFYQRHKEPLLLLPNGHPSSVVRHAFYQRMKDDDTRSCFWYLKGEKDENWVQSESHFEILVLASGAEPYIGANREGFKLMVLVLPFCRGSTW